MIRFALYGEGCQQILQWYINTTSRGAHSIELARIRSSGSILALGNHFLSNTLNAVKPTRSRLTSGRSLAKCNPEEKTAMLRKLAIALLLTSCSIAVLAAPISFTSSQFETFAFASGGSSTSFESGNSPPDQPPLVSSAAAGTTDVATGSAIAAQGLLATSADAFSSAGPADAIGFALFVGSFFGSGDLIELSLDFSASTSLVGTSSFSDSFAQVQVFSEGVTLFSETLSSTGLYQFSFAPAAGGLSSLQLSVNSDANTLAQGSASSFALLTFSAQTQSVSEPATLALVTLALGGIAFRRGQRA
jgi:hypothetical protein